MYFFRLILVVVLLLFSIVKSSLLYVEKTDSSLDLLK